MDAPEVDSEIRDNRALAQTLGISGTPTFVIGDRMVRGYLPAEEMATLIEEERADCEKERLGTEDDHDRVFLGAEGVKRMFPIEGVR